jgi:hypothetical protein
LPRDNTYEEFEWLQGGPHLEVGFLRELMTSREDFLSDFLKTLGQTTPKVEIVSTPTELDQAKKDFLSDYPWDPKDEQSFICHVWDALARVHFREIRECLIKINQMSDVLMLVNFNFWGDSNDGWGQKGLKNDELPDFAVFLQSLSGLSKFIVGTVGFHVWAPFLFSTDNCFPHPDYDLKNLTSDVIKANADKFIYVLARRDLFNAADNSLEDDSYFVIKIDDVLKQSNQT